MITIAAKVLPCLLILLYLIRILNISLTIDDGIVGSDTECDFYCLRPPARKTLFSLLRSYIFNLLTTFFFCSRERSFASSGASGLCGLEVRLFTLVCCSRMLCVLPYVGYFTTPSGYMCLRTDYAYNNECYTGDIHSSFASSGASVQRNYYLNFLYLGRKGYEI